MLASQSFRNVSRAPIRALGQALSSLASAPAPGPKFARKRWQKPPRNRRVEFPEFRPVVRDPALRRRCPRPRDVFIRAKLEKVAVERGPIR